MRNCARTNPSEHRVYHFDRCDSRPVTKGTPFVSRKQSMARPTPPTDNICLDAKAVKHCVTYSEQQLTRLEAAGLFPKRIHIGPGRVGWVFREILDWMQSKVDERPVGPMSPKVIIETSDRFVHTRELRSMVLYTPHHVRNLERAEKFPGRIRLSDNRVVWLERELHDWLETQRKRDEADAAKTYHVRLCRPRFEVTTVKVKADSPSTAERTALELADVSKSSWHLVPSQPEVYQAHVEISVLEEKPTYSAEAVQDILARYGARYVRYLLLLADTNRGEGTALFQPWLTDQTMHPAARDFASNWVEAINRHLNPNTNPRKRRGRPRKRAEGRSR